MPCFVQTNCETMLSAARSDRLLELVQHLKYTQSAVWRLGTTQKNTKSCVTCTFSYLECLLLGVDSA